MAKRKKKDPVVIILFTAIVTLILNLIFKLVLFLYNYILFYKTKYKNKSGVGFFKMYFDKGYFGEFKFYTKLIKIFPQDNIFLNMYLDNEKTSYTEIDIVGVHKTGIYVFEIKNYGGWIYGNDKDEKWTQVFNKYSKHKFYNPVRQNFAHTKAIEKYLEIPSDNIHSFIAFSNRSKLKKITSNFESNIHNFRDSISIVKKRLKTSNDILEDEQVATFLEKLKVKTLVSDEIKEEHIDSVNKKYNN